NAVYPAAFKTLQEEGALAQACELRPVKYLNNRVEQDHRFMCCAPLCDQTQSKTRLRICRVPNRRGDVTGRRSNEPITQGASSGNE
ncbi:MAG: transposase, partial [Actinomycetota bacterium]|nr:transposase [Actinomycetota bacterium]